jgi:hypothetical protein
MSLAGGQLEKAHCLALIFRKTVEPGTVTHAEIVLRSSISSIGGELEEASGFAVIPHDPAKP